MSGRIDMERLSRVTFGTERDMEDHVLAYVTQTMMCVSRSLFCCRFERERIKVGPRSVTEEVKTRRSSGGPSTSRTLRVLLT